MCKFIDWFFSFSFFLFLRIYILAALFTDAGLKDLRSTLKSLPVHSTSFLSFLAFWMFQAEDKDKERKRASDSSVLFPFYIINFSF